MKTLFISLLSMVLFIVITYVSTDIVPEDLSISNEMILNNKTDWTINELESFVAVNGGQFQDNERSSRLRRSCDCWTTLGRCMSIGSKQCYFVNGVSVVKCIGESRWKRTRRCSTGCIWNEDNPYCI